MKTLMTSTLLVLLTLLPGCAFGQNSFTKADSLAIKKASHAFEVAFNTHDAKALASLFLPNAEFTNVVGATATGRKAIEEFHAPMFAGKPGYFSFKYSTLKK